MAKSLNVNKEEAMSKTIYSAQVTFEIEVDPADAKGMAKAATFMEQLQEGKIPSPLEGVTITAKPPRITNKRD